MPEQIGVSGSFASSDYLQMCDVIAGQFVIVSVLAVAPPQSMAVPHVRGRSALHTWIWIWIWPHRWSLVVIDTDVTFHGISLPG